MRNNELISVIVPVYNVELYLQQCLDSIIGQSYSNLEIILVDDGSTDSSGSICDEYAVRDKRIKVIHQQNRGLAAARNSGLRHITGEWISFVDSDDWIELNMYEMMLSSQVEHEDADIVICTHQRVYSEQVNNMRGSGNIYVFTQKQLINEYTSTKSNFYISPSVWDRIYRKELINNLEFPEGRLNEDIAYSVEVFCRTQKAVYIDKALYNYRCNRLGSISGSEYSQKRIDDNIYLRTEAENILKTHGYYKESDLMFVEDYKFFYGLELTDDAAQIMKKEYCRSQKRRILKVMLRPCWIPLRKKIGLFMYVFMPTFYQAYVGKRR